MITVTKGVGYTYQIQCCDHWTIPNRECDLHESEQIQIDVTHAEHTNLEE